MNFNSYAATVFSIRRGYLCALKTLDLECLLIVSCSVVLHDTQTLASLQCVSIHAGLKQCRSGIKRYSFMHRRVHRVVNMV